MLRGAALAEAARKATKLYFILALMELEVGITTEKCGLDDCGSTGLVEPKNVGINGGGWSDIKRKFCG